MAFGALRVNTGISDEAQIAVVVYNNSETALEQTATSATGNGRGLKHI